MEREYERWQPTEPGRRGWMSGEDAGRPRRVRGGGWGVGGLLKLVQLSDGWDVEGNTTWGPQGMTEQVHAAFAAFFPGFGFWEVRCHVLRHCCCLVLAFCLTDAEKHNLLGTNRRCAVEVFIRSLSQGTICPKGTCI